MSDKAFAMVAGFVGIAVIVMVFSGLMMQDGRPIAAAIVLAFATIGAATAGTD